MAPVQRTRAQLTLLAAALVLGAAVRSVAAHSHAVLDVAPTDAGIAATPMMGPQLPIVWGG
jgi:hypothetical protein